MILNGKPIIAVWNDSNVGIKRGQRLLAVRTGTSNRTLYLYDSEGRRPGWVSGDVIDAGDWDPSYDEIYIATVTEIVPNPAHALRFKVTLEAFPYLFKAANLRNLGAWPTRLGKTTTEFYTSVDPQLRYQIFGSGAAEKSVDTKGTTMSNLSKAVTGRVSTVVATNGEAMQKAAFLEAGVIVNRQLSKLAAAKLPLMVRGYAASPIGNLVIANLFAVAIRELRPNDRNLSRLADASLEAAHLDVIRTLDIDGLIDELLSEDGIKRALGKVAEVEGAQQ